MSVGLIGLKPEKSCLHYLCNNVKLDREMEMISEK